MFSTMLHVFNYVEEHGYDVLINRSWQCQNRHHPVSPSK